MSLLSSATRPRASLSAFREAGLSLHSRLYAAQAKGGPVKQHGKHLRWRFLSLHFYGTERNGTRSAQGFKGSKSQKLTKRQKRMEAMQKNKSPGVRGQSESGCNADRVYSYLGIYITPC
jgi:hypothetical protein